MAAPHASPPGEIRLLLGGDVMTGRAIDLVMRWPQPAAGSGLRPRDARRRLRAAEALHGPIPLRNEPDYVWGDALAEMDRLRVPLRIVNLATAVTSANTAWLGKAEPVRMSPRHADCLAAARISACALANDRVLDWDYPGLKETLRLLAQAGIVGVGAGIDLASAQTPAVLDTGSGSRVLVFSWATPDAGVPAGWGATAGRPGIALLTGLGGAEAREVQDCVERHRRPGDVVVVSLHWGGRQASRVPAAHREFAHRLVEAGAVDVLHGHGSRIALPMEVHRGRLLLHGCGDLVNDEEASPAPAGLRPDVACLYAVTLAADGRLLRLELVPFVRRRFRLERADEASRAWLARWLNTGWPAFNTLVSTDASEAGRVRWEEHALSDAVAAGPPVG